MSDSLTLSRTIIDLILTAKVRFHDKRCLLTFAWAIVGVLLKKNRALEQMGIQSGKAVTQIVGLTPSF